MIKENIVFFREFFAEFQNTGSPFATSRWAAEALTRPVRSRHFPKKILELGPGTGSVTIRILRDMHEGDELTLCEINPRFMRTLKQRLSRNKYYLKHKQRITFFEGPMQKLPETASYDIIVCALPFLNFDVATVKEIFAKLKRLCSERTVMTHYEYIGLRSLGKSVALPHVKRRIKELDSFFGSVYTEHDMSRQRVWLNVLPIYIYTLKFAA